MNYQIKMEEIIRNLPKDRKSKLLLHVCCGPCSSSVLEILKDYFDITVYYYNPNIYPEKEFLYRFAEVERLIQEMNVAVDLIKAPYENHVFEQEIEGLREEREGGSRCFICYRLRMEHAATYAKKNGFDYFTTTLSISPHKNAKALNEIGQMLETKHKISYLFADFKKKNGYKRSIELSTKYHLYRQDYCGCVYSQREGK